MCSDIETLEIPAGVVSIGDSAFGQCESLRSVVLPEGLERLGRSAFYSCGKLSEIALPSTLTEIGNTPFKSCGALQQIDVDSRSVSYISIDGVLYDYDRIRLIAYPPNKADMSYCIPDGTTRIGTAAFIGCRNLTEITIAPSVQEIEDDAFLGCRKLRQMEIPEGVEYIGDTAFVNCYDLSKITLPASLLSLGVDSFESCGSLTDISVAQGNAAYVSEDGVLFSADRTKLVAYPAGKQQASYSVPDGVRCIGEYAFLFVKNLKDIALPEGLTTIETRAFGGCEFASIAFPQSLVEIGDHAFNSCENLTQIVIPANVQILGDGAFDWCDALMSVTVEGSATSFDKWGVFEYCHDSLVIHGQAGSTAELYATEEGIPFQAIGAEDAWTCAGCNSENDGGKFCPECGEARPQAKKCANCGYEPEEGASPKFCSECGTQFE